MLLEVGKELVDLICITSLGVSHFLTEDGFGDFVSSTRSLIDKPLNISITTSPSNVTYNMIAGHIENFLIQTKEQLDMKIVSSLFVFQNVKF